MSAPYKGALNKIDLQNIFSISTISDFSVKSLLSELFFKYSEKGIDYLLYNSAW